MSQVQRVQENLTTLTLAQSISALAAVRTLAASRTDMQSPRSAPCRQALLLTG